MRTGVGVCRGLDEEGLRVRTGVGVCRGLSLWRLVYIERLIPNIPEAKKAGVGEKALGVGNCGHLEGREVISMGMRGREGARGESSAYIWVWEGSGIMGLGGIRDRGFGRDQESES